jgi:predicted sugar kinase
MSMMMKETFLDAQIALYQGQLKVEEANILNLIHNSVGIGEHTSISDDIDKHIAKIAELKEKIEVAESLK